MDKFKGLIIRYKIIEYLRNKICVAFDQEKINFAYLYNLHNVLKISGCRFWSQSALLIISMQHINLLSDDTFHYWYAKNSWLMRAITSVITALLLIISSKNISPSKLC